MIRFLLLSKIILPQRAELLGHDETKRENERSTFDHKSNLFD